MGEQSVRLNIMAVPRRAGGRWTTHVCPMRMSPEVTCSCPAIRRRVVVLPQPLVLTNTHMYRPDREIQALNSDHVSKTLVTSTVDIRGFRHSHVSGARTGPVEWLTGRLVKPSIIDMLHMRKRSRANC